MDIDIVLLPWNEALSMFESGLADGLTGYFYSPQRKSNALFSIPHCYVTPMAFFRDELAFKDFSDLEKYKIIVQEGDVMHDFVREKNLGSGLFLCENPGEALKSLNNGDGQVALLPGIIGKYYRHLFAYEHIDASYIGVESRKYCFAVQPDENDLLYRINEAMVALKLSGQYDTIYEKWFGVYEEDHIASWFSQNMIFIVTIVVLIALLSALWIFIMQRRIRIQTLHLKLALQKQMETEENLVKARDKAEESDRLKSAFLANMSHEIRTPLNGIMGFSKLLSGAAAEKQKKYIDVIQSCSGQLLTLINDIMDVSKIEANLLKLNPEKENLNTILDELYMQYLPQLDKSDVNLLVSRGLPDKKAFFIVDGNRLRQIFGNLLSNAVRYTEKGSLSFGYTLNGDEEPEFFVIDTGKGIPESEKDNVFERFGQVKDEFHKGTGLGLFIVKNLVNLMGGKITLEDTPGGGATFRFTIRAPGQE